MLFPAFWEKFKRKINFINSDTMTIILYCSLTPILRLEITNILGRTSLIRCIIKKVFVPNCGNIWGASPLFCYWGTSAPTQPPTSTSLWGKKNASLHGENYSLSLNLNSIDSYLVTCQGIVH
jgi:hypothetical protein